MEIEKHRFTDFFDLLDVDRNASKEDVQKAFMIKASVWHPDKADTDEDREYYTKIYQDLQTAYKILSNEQSRKQYIDAQQTTDLEFKFAERDAGYSQTDQFRAEDGRFDDKAFKNAFEKMRDQKEHDTLKQLQQTQYGRTGTVNENDLQSLLSRRDAELAQLSADTAQIFSGTGHDFDSDTFNRAFDYMKEKTPGKGVQAYEGDPMAMYSSGGLEECDPMSGIIFHNGTDFTGQHMDNLVLGQSINPGGELNLQALQTGEQYSREQKLTNNEIQSRMAAINADRENLATIDKERFIIEPSDIEKLYSDLFQPMNIECLEAPARAGSGSGLESSPKAAVKRESNKIRKKIEQIKNSSKIEKKSTI